MLHKSRKYVTSNFEEQIVFWKKKEEISNHLSSHYNYGLTRLMEIYMKAVNESKVLTL